MGGTVPVGQTRIERGFIGAHADIGGGFGPNDNQLAQVVLAWMVDQAEAAGVTMQAPPSTIIANPVIHDKSNNIQTGRPKEGFLVGGEDRQVRYLNGTTTTQRKMTDTGMTYADTDQFISYFDRDTLERDPGRLDENGDIVDDFIMTNKTGTVDMRGYLDWLNANGYNINLTVQ